MPVISTIAAATARAFGAFKAAAGGAADEFFNYVTLLLHGDGTNGAQNNTFLDSSTNNFTITRNGNTTQGTFSPFSLTEGQWSNYFDGSGDYLTAASNAAFGYGTGDFTIECWFYLNTLPGGVAGAYLIDQRTTSPQVTPAVYVYSDGSIQCFVNGSTVITGGSVVINQWNHWALSRASGTTKMFLNGTQIGSSYSDSNSYITAPVAIGARFNGQDFVTGYISNFRIVKGTAVYTSAFTPSTTPLTAISGTSLLTCQSNRFRDASTNNFAITVNGNTSVQAFSPFAPTAAYSAATVGGSGYFDGSGDYLTVPDNAAYEVGSSDFTEEFWIYPTAASMTGSIIDKRSGAGSYSECPQIQIASNQPIAYVSYSGSSWAVTINGSSNVKPYSWNHIALTRSGSTWTLWLNGASVGSATSSGTVYAGSSSLVIGAASSAGEVPITGYLSSVRIVKGTALYTSAFTPPTAPLTAVANTQLLLNFTNAGILDNTGRNDLETVGNAQISTSVKKFGTGSLAFDGSGDDLRVIDNAGLVSNFGTGAFTVEFWIYANSWGAFNNIVDFRKSTDYMAIMYLSGNISYYNDGSARISGGSLSTATWHHIALTRSGTSTKLFVNGTQVGSTYTDSTNYPAQGIITIGARNDDAGNPFNGYIDDLRITKGVARYTANFTPPTAAFKDQ